jgi:hypothetical protein
MNNRRRFLLQSTLATTAFIAAKPFTSFAKGTSFLSQKFPIYNHITFLHTVGRSTDIVNRVKKLTNNAPSLLLAHDDKKNFAEPQLLRYDFYVPTNNSNPEAYTIIEKEHVRVGIISVNITDTNPIAFANKNASLLKREQGCSIVVCISNLGFESKNEVDDLNLAEQSEHIDLILGNYSSSSLNIPMIAQNKNKAEVIIQHTENNTEALSKIKIGFSANGTKQHVSF